MTQTVRRGGEKEKDGGGAIKSRCWFEFVLKKDALPQHLAALKRGEAVLPDTTDLLKMFVNQIAKSMDTPGGTRRTTLNKREKLLFKLTCQVVNEMDVSLKDMEEAISSDQLRRFLEYLIFESEKEGKTLIGGLKASDVHWVHLGRYVLRATTKNRQIPIQEIVPSPLSPIKVRLEQSLEEARKAKRERERKEKEKGGGGGGGLLGMGPGGGGGLLDTPPGGGGGLLSTPPGGGGGLLDTPPGGGLLDTPPGVGLLEAPPGGGGLLDAPPGGGLLDAPPGGGLLDAPPGGGGLLDVPAGGGLLGGEEGGGLLDDVSRLEGEKERALFSLEKWLGEQEEEKLGGGEGERVDLMGFRCVVNYDIGEHFFLQEKFGPAEKYFKEALRLLVASGGTKKMSDKAKRMFPDIQETKLRAFVQATSIANLSRNPHEIVSSSLHSLLSPQKRKREGEGAVEKEEEGIEGLVLPWEKIRSLTCQEQKQWQQQQQSQQQQQQQQQQEQRLSMEVQMCVAKGDLQTLLHLLQLDTLLHLSSLLPSSSSDLPPSFTPLIPSMRLNLAERITTHLPPSSSSEMTTKTMSTLAENVIFICNIIDVTLSTTGSSQINYFSDAVRYKGDTTTTGGHDDIWSRSGAEFLFLACRRVLEGVWVLGGGGGGERGEWVGAGVPEWVKEAKFTIKPNISFDVAFQKLSMLVREVVVGGVGGGGAGGVSGGEWRFSLAKKIVPLLLGEMTISPPLPLPDETISFYGSLPHTQKDDKNNGLPPQKRRKIEGGGEEKRKLGGESFYEELLGRMEEMGCEKREERLGSRSSLSNEQIEVSQTLLSSLSSRGLPSFSLTTLLLSTLLNWGSYEEAVAICDAILKIIPGVSQGKAKKNDDKKGKANNNNETNENDQTNNMEVDNGPTPTTTTIPTKVERGRWRGLCGSVRHLCVVMMGCHAQATKTMRAMDMSMDEDFEEDGEMVGGEGGMEGGDGGEGGEEGKGDESGLLPPPSSSFSAIPTIKQISEDFLVFTEFVKTSNDPDENNKGHRSIIWTSEAGILHKISNNVLLNTLVSFFAALVVKLTSHCREHGLGNTPWRGIKLPKGDIYLGRYGENQIVQGAADVCFGPLLRHSRGGDIVFCKPLFHPLGFHSIRCLLRETTLRWRDLSPSEPLRSLAVGDAYLQLSKHQEAVESYLRATAASNYIFYNTSVSFSGSLGAKVAPLPTSGVIGTVLSGLIEALEGINAPTQAVVLLQFMDKIDYERAFTILKAHHSNISSMFLDYVWDMPLLEFLAFLFSQKYPNKEKYERVMGMIQNPQLNEHNRDSEKNFFLTHLKRSFLTHLLHQFRIV